jgi:predicted HTH domain antitoxin
VPEEDVYPLAELTKLEKVDLSSILSSVLKEWIQKEAMKLYQEGKLTISRASEILGISIWEMADLIKKENIPLQVGKTS